MTETTRLSTAAADTFNNLEQSHEGSQALKGSEGMAESVPPAVDACGRAGEGSLRTGPRRRDEKAWVQGSEIPAA